MIFVLGPCSAETEQQVLQTAKELRQTLLAAPFASLKEPIKFFFRAGLWKPRTMPNSFEGVGKEGIVWLSRVEKECHFNVCTEIACREHLQLCLAGGLRSFWIGARSTINPFIVQQIADEIAHFDEKDALTIMVKNPVSADLELWLGAIERIRQAGVNNIYAIHRGFTPSQPTPYRNTPLWSIPIELKRRHPELKLLCDVSHIAGKRELIGSLINQSVNLCFDGLMVEIHCSPCNALSDAQQQITSSEFAQIFSHIALPQHQSEISQLRQLRQQIDEIDESLWQLVLQRQQVSRQIGEVKKKSNLPVLQVDRYNELLSTRTQWAEQNGLSADVAKKITEALHESSIAAQL